MSEFVRMFSDIDPLMVPEWRWASRYKSMALGVPGQTLYHKNLGMALPDDPSVLRQPKNKRRK